MATQPTQPAFEITLVHGTWGRGVLFKAKQADWTCDYSDLCRRLNAPLDGRVQWHRFIWSGRNSHEARTRAALRLRADLKARLAESPTAKHVVIAHSHGGNVALIAIDNELRDKLHGVACLATPFVVASKRDWGVDEAGLAAGGLLAMVGAILVLTYWLLPSSMSMWARFLAGTAGAMLLAFITTTLLSRLEPFTNELLALLGDRRPTPKNLLILRSPADEAGIAISLFIFLSHLTIRLFRIIQAFERWWNHILERAERRPRVVVGLFALAVVGFFFYIPLFIYVQDRPSLAWLGQIAMSLVVVLFLLAGTTAVASVIGGEIFSTFVLVPVGVALVPCLMLVSLLTLIPFGWRAAAANLLLAVSAESTPWGEHPVRLIPTQHHREMGTDTVAASHSIHSNPGAHQVLANWLLEMA